MDPTRPADIRPGDVAEQEGPLPLLDTLGTWARVVLEETYADPPTGRTDVVRWLLDRSRFAWICRQPWADEMAEEVRAAVATCRAYAGAGWLTHRLWFPCPTCGVLALQRQNGAEDVVCGACWSRWTWDEYRWLARVVTDEAEGAA